MKQKKLAARLSAVKAAASNRPKLPRSSPSTTKTPRRNPSAIPKRPYAHHNSILLVGEGNFSFAACLLDNVYCQDPQRMTATSFDSRDTLVEKYPDANAHVDVLMESGVTVLHGIDATKLHTCKHLKGRLYDQIVFNFPHVGAGIKDQDRNILANQRLVSAFFACAIHLLSPSGEIHIALKNKHPYTRWNVQSLASTAGLSLKAKIPFFPETMYPGYTHRRTIGFDETVSSDHNYDLQRGEAHGTCVTFVFWRTELARNACESKKAKRKRDDDNNNNNSVESDGE